MKPAGRGPGRARNDMAAPNNAAAGGVESRTGGLLGTALCGGRLERNAVASDRRFILYTERGGCSLAFAASAPNAALGEEGEMGKCSSPRPRKL
jgi:hypothetical protein